MAAEVMFATFVIEMLIPHKLMLSVSLSKQPNINKTTSNCQRSGLDSWHFSVYRVECYFGLNQCDPVSFSVCECVLLFFLFFYIY